MYSFSRLHNIMKSYLEFQNIVVLCLKYEYLYSEFFCSKDVSVYDPYNDIFVFKGLKTSYDSKSFVFKDFYYRKNIFYTSFCCKILFLKNGNFSSIHFLLSTRVNCRIFKILIFCLFFSCYYYLIL